MYNWSMSVSFLCLTLGLYLWKLVCLLYSSFTCAGFANEVWYNKNISHVALNQHITRAEMALWAWRAAKVQGLTNYKHHKVIQNS